MLRRILIKGAGEALASARSVCAPRRQCLPLVVASFQVPTRGLAAGATKGVSVSVLERPPGTPAPGREQTLGEAFCAMQYHGRGSRKIKASVLHNILRRTSSEEELKYGQLGLELFKKQGIPLSHTTGTLFVKACCRSGSPRTAVDTLAQPRKYGLGQEGVVTAQRFNYLLSQLYRTGDAEYFRRAVADASARKQVLNPRSHELMSRFEEEEREKREIEDERLREAAEAKAGVDEEDVDADADVEVDVDDDDR